MITFKNVQHDHVKACFTDVVKKFSPLHGHHIRLVRRKLKNTTMQAQPIFDWNILFRHHRRYRIDFTFETDIDDPVRIENLPEDVMTGWFAHELGHLVDYQMRSLPSLIGLGVGYVFSERLKIKAEMQADLYAIKYGFSEEILATKRFILNHSDISQKYKDQISKFYMSPEEVERYILERGQSLLELDDIHILPGNK